MDKLYFFITSSDIWKNQDPHSYLNNYFISEGAFMNAFLIALAVAVVGILIYYVWIGFAVPRLANLTTWVVTLVCVGGITFGLTQVAIMGSSNANTGVFESITQHHGKLRADTPDTALAQLDSNTQSLQTTLQKPLNQITTRMDIGNTCFALLIFFCLSLCVKRITTYTISIPF